MSEPFVIPSERLPPGFADRIERPPLLPAEAHPAATAVLMRDQPAGPEVLLLKRHRSSGFVPGAYVFPGGRVDAADAGVPWPGTADPPAEYWTAALREIFEETGVLLARTSSGRWAPSAAADPRLEQWREELMSGRASLADVLAAERLEPAHNHIVYLAHWITPIAEPRRYDTRFFLAHLPEQREVRADPREMVDAVWLRPAAALERFEAGTLPMVFPTVMTLKLLLPYDRVDAALEAFRHREIKPVLPRLVRTPEGVGIEVDEN